MLCRGNCDDDNQRDNDRVSPEEPSDDLDEPFIAAAGQLEPQRVSGESRSLCRDDCDVDESNELARPDQLNDYNLPRLPVDHQPEPDTVPDRADEESTDRDGVMADEQYPERTEFVVHVEQHPDMAARPPSEPTAQSHHHHQHQLESGSGTSSNGRRRHHRLACLEYEARERQCLNGGQCFAIQLHNGIRRSGCRFVVFPAFRPTVSRRI